MPGSEQIYTDLQGIEGQLGQYNLGAAPGVIRDQLNQAVGGFQPQYQELARQEGRAYGMPQQVMAAYEKAQNSGQFMAPGMSNTQFTGTNPLSRLGNSLGQIGEQFGVADSMSKGLDFQKGRLEDIIGKIGNQYNTSYEQMLGKYNRQLPFYQMALQREEAEKQRAEARAARGAAARAAAQQQADIMSMLGGGQQSQQQQQQQAPNNPYYQNPQGGVSQIGGEDGFYDSNIVREFPDRLDVFSRLGY